MSVRLKGCNSLVTISEGAFNGCRRLSNFDFSQLIALKEIGQGAFNECALAGDITFASGLTQIGSNAFHQNEGITSIDFSKSTQLAAVSSETFSSCWGLKKVDFSNCVSLNTLNTSAFDGCSSLEEVVIDNGFYTSIAGVLFVVDKATLLLYPGGKKDAFYTIPATVMTLGEHSFPYNESLMELNIPASVRTIKGKAFNGSFSGRGAKVIVEAAEPIKLSQSIGLDNALVYVPKGSAKAYRLADFWKDSKIVEIDADPVVVTLDAAGSLGAKLTELNIPLATILELNIIGPMNASDFEVIKQIELLQKADLSKATMEENRLPNYAFGNGRYGSAPELYYLEEVILPNTIKEIGGYAFSNLSALRKVNMPESVEQIGESAFSECSSLQKIDLSSLSHLKEIRSNAFSSSSCVPAKLELPEGLETISGSAFSGTGVTSVDFSNTSLYNIAYNAFSECPIIGTLSFPATLRSIGNSAFASAKVSSITLRSTEMVRWDGADVFKSVDKTKCKVYVPKGLKDTYKADTYWSPFGNNIVEYGQMITVTTNNEYGGRVEGGGAYEKGESVTVKAIAQNEIFFDGWYENGKKISTEPELTFVMGEEARSLEARFYRELMVFDGGYNLVNDQNKVDGPSVILHGGNLAVEGKEVWKPRNLSFYRGASLLVDSDIQTEEISFNWDTWSGDWYFVSFPYDLKISEIKLTSSDARMVVREYDGKSRAGKGVGSSWRQLSSSDMLRANTGYIIQFNSGDGMADAFTTKTGDMKALLNRASVTIPLNTYASANVMDANWNFVGNPYPAYYSVERLFADGLDATVTVWSPDLNNYEYYTQDDKDVYLTPLTAFFVQKKTSNLVFNPEGRVAALPRETQAASALRSVDNRQVVNLLLAGEKASDRTRVVFNEEASMEYEIGLDAAKFSSPNKDAASFYSLDKDGNRLAINERPVADGVVRLGCVLPAKGSYTISLKERIGKGIQLVDKQTGAVCDLNQEAYTFEAEAGTFSDRFELRSDVVTSVEAIDASIRWNVREGLLIVSGLRDVETLNVCDAVGRIHFAGKVTDGEVRIALPQSGIYYMTWTTKAGERQTRSIKW